MALPKISIIIPTHNSSAYISDAINSAKISTGNLTHEILLVDDNSSDIDTLENIANNYTSVQIIKKKKKGNASESRNIGIKSSKGDYVFLLDADDEYQPSHIQDRIALHNKIQTGIIFGNFFTQSRELKKSELPLPRIKEDIRDYIFNRRGDFRSSTISISKHYFNGATFDTNQEKHQDWGFAIRSQTLSETIGFDINYGVLINERKNRTRMSSRANIPATVYFLETYISNSKLKQRIIKPIVKQILTTEDQESANQLINYIDQNIKESDLWTTLKLNTYRLLLRTPNLIRTIKQKMNISESS